MAGTAGRGWDHPADHSRAFDGLVGVVIDHAVFHWLGDEAGQVGRVRCGLSDVHVLRMAPPRLINATPVESRLGTDLIYYHVPTHSFVLVQYKRINANNQSIGIDARLLDQLDRLEAVAKLSENPTQPHDWRLGNDPCFLKLAYWRDNREGDHDLARGPYLPLSYVRLLLADDCTRGPRGGRVFNVNTVDRYLVASEFIDLVKHGLVGTVGTTVEKLRELGTRRAEEGYSLMTAAESSPETARQRQNRTNRRGSKDKTRVSLNRPGMSGDLLM